MPRADAGPSPQRRRVEDVEVSAEVLPSSTAASSLATATEKLKKGSGSKKRDQILDVASSTALLSARLKREIHEVWSAATTISSKQEAPSSSGGIDVIPLFKVGTTEMYRRFPEAYECFMQRHDCSAVEAYLLDEVLGRIVASAGASEATNLSAPLLSIQVADFGCGTGRIESMVSRHPAVSSIYAYDSEMPMLKRCLVSTVRCVGAAGHRRGVLLLPRAEAGTENGSTEAPDNSPVVLCGPATAGEDGKPATMTLCMRPCSFEAVQQGFLEATHHPKCQMIVCAWSLSYVMRQQWGQDRWHAAVDATVQSFLRLLDHTVSDAAVVILETLGNGSAEPTRQNTYTKYLEDTYGFTRCWVRTDYSFKDSTEAHRMVRFFFGDAMLSKLTVSQESEAYSLMECTGIWILWKERGAV